MNRRLLALSLFVAVVSLAVVVLNRSEPVAGAEITPELRAHFEQTAIDMNLPVEAIEAAYLAGIEAQQAAVSGTMSSNTSPFEKAVRTCYGDQTWASEGWRAYSPCGSGAPACVAYVANKPSVEPYIYTIQCRVSG